MGTALLPLVHISRFGQTLERGDDSHYLRVESLCVKRLLKENWLGYNYITEVTLSFVEIGS